MSEWGFADMYAMDDEPTKAVDLQDVQSDDWRNIMVLGRATETGVFPETLALVGRARYLADELGCRVEVLLIGENLDAATKVLSSYPINTVYTVKAPTYAPIDQTAKILEQVVRKRRPELVLVFQSRTGDAVTAYTANRLGVGHIVGATHIELDTMERRAVVTHTATNEGFQTVTDFHEVPQFVSVQRGLFRAPMEDPYANVQVHALEVDAGRVADIRVVSQAPPAEPTLETADRVVVIGARAQAGDMAAARELAKAFKAVVGVTQSVVDRGLADAEALVSEGRRRIAPKLLVTVGVRGSLDFTQAIGGNPTIAAVGSEATDPIAERAHYLVEAPIQQAIQEMLDSL